MAYSIGDRLVVTLQLEPNMEYNGIKVWVPRDPLEIGDKVTVVGRIVWPSGRTLYLVEKFREKTRHIVYGFQVEEHLRLVK